MTGDDRPIWFFHAGVYTGALESAPGDVALLHVHCPHCGARYVTTMDGGATALAGSPAALAAAVTALGRECPDHPHRFAVPAGAGP